MSAGGRNLLQRLARSRAARDARSLGLNLAAALMLVTYCVGVYNIMAWLVKHGGPALARLLGWL